jgi:anti-anti-sigma factor
MPSNATPEIRKQDGVTVIALGPEFETLDEWGLDALGKSMLDAAEDADPPKVVVDLANVKFFGSSFIEILFRVWNRLNTRDGGQFGISGLAPYCREILEVTHLDKLWRLYESETDAVAGMSGK